MKILLAVDGSVYSDAAVEEVTKRPWPPQSEVKVITAAETPLVVGMEHRRSTSNNWRNQFVTQRGPSSKVLCLS